MRISDWSSDVCSSDLPLVARLRQVQIMIADLDTFSVGLEFDGGSRAGGAHGGNGSGEFDGDHGNCLLNAMLRSEEHPSELQSLMRISYAVFCLKKNKPKQTLHTYTRTHTPTLNKNKTSSRT